MKKSPIPRSLADLLRLPWPPPWRARGHRRAARQIPANMAAAMERGEALAWSHSELAGQLWEHGARASRAVELAKKTVDGIRTAAISSPVATDRRPDPAEPGTLKTHEKMKIDLTTKTAALAYLRSLDPSTEIELPGSYNPKPNTPAADAVEVLSGESANTWASAAGRWDWTAGELVTLFSDELTRRSFNTAVRAVLESDSAAWPDPVIYCEEVAGTLTFGACNAPALGGNETVWLHVEADSFGDLSGDHEADADAIEANNYEQALSDVIAAMERD